MVGQKVLVLLPTFTSKFLTKWLGSLRSLGVWAQMTMRYLDWATKERGTDFSSQLDPEVVGTTRIAGDPKKRTG